MWPGQPYPLGATYDGVGTNFALFSEVAERVELCLFDDAGGGEKRLEVTEADGYVWHCFLPGVGPGQRYGYRVHGPHFPEAGVRCNDTKLLLDPYARALDGQVKWDPAVYGYPLGGDDRERNDEDSAPFVPRAVVTNPWFEWGDDHPLRIPWHETVLYECHVKGLTMRHPEVPPDLRGTYAGMAHPAVIEHLKRLGVTAVELMPVHQFVQDHYLLDSGPDQLLGIQLDRLLRPAQRVLRLGRRAGRLRVQVPGQDHAPGRDRGHTRRRLQPHRRGEPLGPTLSFRGIDNPAYYRLADGGRYYFDTTGTGNTLNMPPSRPPTDHRLVRYWVRRCTWTASASTSPPAWPASSTRSTGCRPSSTSSRWTRW